MASASSSPDDGANSSLTIEAQVLSAMGATQCATGLTYGQFRGIDGCKLALIFQAGGAVGEPERRPSFAFDGRCRRAKLERRLGAEHDRQDRRKLDVTA
jgi:hypothetical protein